MSNDPVADVVLECMDIHPRMFDPKDLVVSFIGFDFVEAFNPTLRQGISTERRISIDLPLRELTRRIQSMQNQLLLPWAEAREMLWIEMLRQASRDMPVAEILVDSSIDLIRESCMGQPESWWDIRGLTNWGRRPYLVLGEDQFQEYHLRYQDVRDLCRYLLLGIEE